MPQVFKVTQDIWYPTVKEIREFPIPLNDDQIPRMRDWALNTWLDFGKKLGFSERVEARKAKAAEQTTEQKPAEKKRHRPGTRACGWKECLCSWDVKPPHSMRLCKGCWRAWYCGHTCQSL